MSSEFENLICVLRAIIISRKQPCSIAEVSRDYQELENRPIPYRNLGCSCLLDIFEKSGEFLLKKTPFGETYVSTKSNIKSAHIAELVRRQKTSGRPTHITKSVQPPNRLTRQPMFDRASNWRTVEFDPQLQNKLKNQQKQLHLKCETEKENLKKKKLQERILVDKKSDLKNSSNNDSSGNLKSVQKNISVKKEQKNLRKNLSARENSSFCPKKFRNKSILKNKFLKTQVGSNILTTAELEKSDQKQDTTAASVNQIACKFNPKFDPCESLSMYCAARSLESPIYNVFKSKKGLYSCKLVIKTSTTYITYPKEYSSADSARLACALKAIEEIQKVEARNFLPSFQSDKQFLDVLYNELLLHPNGIISDKMYDWCVDKLEHTMPENWFDLIKNSKRFILDKGIRESTFIVLANKDAVESHTAIDIGMKAGTENIKSLLLPWKKEGWEVYITHCVSTAEIWAILLGAQYNEYFESLTVEINSQMNYQKTHPDVIVPKQIYLAQLCSSWHRVRVESLEKEKQETLCFYIDLGVTEYLPVKKLYLCDSRFLCLAPQAIQLSLFGLEDYASLPNAINLLEKRLLNHAVIAEVLTKERDFEKNYILQVIIYDTSTVDDININLMLRDEMNLIELKTQV